MKVESFHEREVQDDGRVLHLLRNWRVVNISLTNFHQNRKYFIIRTTLFRTIIRRELAVKMEEMNKIIKFELECIPRGPKGSIQNKLRFYYNAYRRRDLARGKQREESLKDAINRLKEEYPDFNSMFDEDFFKISKKNLFQRLMDRIKR